MIPAARLARMGGMQARIRRPAFGGPHPFEQEMSVFKPRHSCLVGRSGLAIVTALLAAACGSDPAGIDEPVDEPDVLTLPFEWTFDAGTDGWDLAAGSTGSAVHDPAEGRIILSGHGGPGEAKSSMSRVVSLPVVAEGVIPWIDVFVAADCLSSGSNDTSLRITAASAEQGTVVVQDWTRIDEDLRPEGGSLEAFAGETVTITIEQDDDGDPEPPDDPEHVCVDRVSIFED